MEDADSVARVVVDNLVRIVEEDSPNDAELLLPYMTRCSRKAVDLAGYHKIKSTVTFCPDDVNNTVIKIELGPPIGVNMPSFSQLSTALH